MDIEKVTEIFCRLSGLEAADAADFRFMCESALGYVMARIRRGADVRRCSGRIGFAAAALAYYRYMLWNLTDSCVNEVKVGDISVRNSGGKELEAADRLCRQAFADISDILENQEFVFQGV